MKKKWLMTSIIAVSLLLGLVSTNTALAAEEQVVKTLTIEEALQLASENSISLKTAALTKASKQVAVQKATSNRRDIEDDNSRQKDEAVYSEKSQKAAYEIANREYKIKKTQIEMEIKQNYYEVLRAKDLVKVSNSALERAEEQFRQTEAKYKLGSVSAIDVMEARSTLTSIRAELETAQNNYTLTEINLSRSIGLATDTHYNLTSIVSYEPLSDVNLQSIIAEATDNRLDILEKAANKELAEINYDIVAGYSAPITYDAKQAKYAAEQAALQLEDTKCTVVYDITKVYFNLQQAQRKITNVNESLELSQEKLYIAQTKYKLGTTTNMDVMIASEDLERAEADYVNVIYDYNLAKLKLETARLAPVN